MVEKQKQEVALSYLGKMAKQSVEDSERWLGGNRCVYSISHHTLALTGAVGKFAHVVKKIERGDLDAKDAKVRMNLAMELTNAFVYMLNIAGLMNFDLDKTYMMTRSNNENRFAGEKRNGANNG